MVLDWLFGMNLSRAYSVTMRRTAHIGRVKTRLLKALVERKLAISMFKPHTTARYAANVGGMEFTSHAFPTGRTAGGVCISSTDETVLIPPPQPYTLSSLLIDVSEATGIDLATAYDTVQALYEFGAISYPRTSSHSLPASGHAGFAAHHAIVTLCNELPSGFSETAHTIFNMIYNNGVMNGIGSAHATRRTTIIDFGGTLFRNVTTWVPHDNADSWMQHDPNELNKYANKPVATFTPGQRIESKPIVIHEPVAQPAPYGEASLLRMMMENGIGTEATRVEAIKSLTRNGMTIMEDGVFIPTIEGQQLLFALPADVQGAAMETMVQESIAKVRASANDDVSGYLLKATKWLISQIHANAPVRPANERPSPLGYDVITDLSCYS